MIWLQSTSNAMEQFFFWLGNIANILSLFTLVVSVLTFLKVQQEARKLTRSLAQVPPVDNLREAIDFAETIHSPKPVALAFSLTPTVGSIKNSVQGFLVAKRWRMPIEEVEMNGLSPDNIQEFYEKVRHEKRRLDLKGYTEVHLFFSGPVQAGTLVGCLFSNWIPVKLYHKTQGGSYEYWMPLLKM
jgi:SMODS-associated and fused to various effectors sensor domain